MRSSWAVAIGLSTLAIAASCGDWKTAPSDPLPVANNVTSGGAGGEGGSGNNGGSGACEGSDVEIVEVGTSPSILLRGRVVSPSQSYEGEVLINGNTIACAGQSCSSEPGATGATIVDTHGIILPGLIDTHNHILFDIFDEDDWAPEMTYTNHDQWPNEERYGAMVDTKQWLNGEDGSPVDVGCEMLKYGEIKGLIAGTTSIQGSPGGDDGCYGSLARSIDTSANDLDDDQIQTATILPDTEAADGVCTNFGDGDTTAYVVHVAEGVDATALNEFATIGSVSTTPNCLYDEKTTIIHGTALTPTELEVLAENGMSLSWSPRSNVFLYGGGTDFAMTTDIPTALDLGINVALSPDWSLGGSQNLLDELRFADELDNAEFGDILTPQMLTEMVTINAARALGLEAQIGSIEVGKRADLIVIEGDPSAPYDALLAATPNHVSLVMVDGVVLYGDADLQALGPVDPGCETLTLCCAEKFLCVAEAGATDKLDQTFAQIEEVLTAELESYDAMNITEWDFAPLTPLVKCPGE